MTQSPYLRVERAPRILSLTLARAPKRNALTGELYQALTENLAWAQEQPDIHVVLLSAEGRDFCAGNDIADFASAKERSEPLETSPVLRFLRTLAAFDKPLIAAVAGHAVGIGATMLLHCDLVYLAEDAQLSAPFVDLGLVPEAASSFLLPLHAGHARAFAIFALGEPVTACAALGLGLANEVLPVEQLASRAQAAAQALANKSLEALRCTKRLMRTPWPLASVIETECRILRDRASSPEAQAAFAAFLHRRRSPSNQ